MTDYYSPEYRGDHCATCGTGLRYVSGVLQGCPWPECPDYGLVPDDGAADPGPPRAVRKIGHIEAARLVGVTGLHGATDDEINAFELELAGAPGTRSLDGAVALEHLEMRAWLDLMEIAGEMLTVEIEHRYRDEQLPACGAAGARGGSDSALPGLLWCQRRRVLERR